MKETASLRDVRKAQVDPPFFPRLKKRDLLFLLGMACVVVYVLVSLFFLFTAYGLR